MLRQWTALNATPLLQNQQKETSEQLEQRLRAEYEEALSHHHKDPHKATHLLTQLSREVSLPNKRPRHPQPLWQRRLRYAVSRNLAAAHDALDQPLPATRAYATALEDDPSDFLVWVRAARNAARSGSLHIARRAYETALNLHPAHCLVAIPHAAVIRAIGDADDDIDQSVTPEVERLATQMIRHRCDYMKQELNHVQPVLPPECITVHELSWACLIDALRACLQRRLQSEGTPDTYNVGHPVTFEIPPSRAQVSPGSSDDVQVVMETHTAPSDVPDVVQVISDSSPCQSNSAAQAHTPKRSPGGSLQLDSFNDIDDRSRVCDPMTPTGSNNPNANANARHSECGTVVNPDATAQSKQSNDKNVVATCPQNPSPEPPITARYRFKGTNTTEEPTGKNPGSEGIDIPYKDSSQVGILDNEDQKKPEVRRSARARAAIDGTIDGERVTGMIDVETTDSELIHTLLSLCTNEHGVTTKSDSDKLAEYTTYDKQNKVNADKDIAANQRICSWTEVIDEQTEAEEVQKCVMTFGLANSGPADLLLRVLGLLSDIRVVQYASTLALLWTTLRDMLQLQTPGSAPTSALIAESMVSSGRKAGKVKAQRFLEAGRLLSNIKLSNCKDEDSRFLEMRLSWCWTLLYECKGEMQLSFASAERTLSLLKGMQLDRSQRIPDSAGPDLAGYAHAALQGVIMDRLARLKSARDLEKAEEELRRAGRGDIEAAKRTIAILGASVRAAVCSLKLDQWDPDDLKTTFKDTAELERWEARLDAEVDLEPRMRVFGDACAKATDIIGELVCFSIRLRMAVRYYAATLRSEVEKEGGQTKSRDSSESRLADLLVQIRKYVALVKKIAGSGSSFLWSCDIGITGWSMEDAVSIACVTLVSLTKLIITKIPILLKFSTGTELGASQKNRRLGLTRCMLAFARCVYVMQKCRYRRSLMVKGQRPVEINESSFARAMLFTTSFCLRVLVTRGCCREEGTSGALMKLYVKFLSLRLQDIATRREKSGKGRQLQRAGNTEAVNSSLNVANVNQKTTHISSAEKPDETDIVDSESNDQTPIPAIDADYSWSNVTMIRHELAQCYECLYRIPDIETGISASQGASVARWLEEGCRISKQIGLSFITGDPLPASPTIDIDSCCNIYFFYRKRIFELFCHQRREGGRGKRLRELLSRLTEALPEDAPKRVPMLPFQALDTIVSEVVDSSEDISKQAAENVSRLEEEWIREEQNKKERDLSGKQATVNIQFSILYFEVFSLHAMSILSAHYSEYKKHKSAERRKHPKEAVDRVLTASSESLIALRGRPWSVGSWILLGRIFVEMTDLALDERELNHSTFGISRSESLQSLGEGDSIATIFGRSEACFGFAESLLRHSWTEKVCDESLPVLSSYVLGGAYDDNDETWKGFGDDGDLFGLFGLTNSTTSRPRLKNEQHPGGHLKTTDSRRLAAIRFGSAALSFLRLREERYFHVHWTLNSLEPKLITHPRNRFPDAVVDLSVLALHQLRAARQLYGMDDSGSDQNDIGSDHQLIPDSHSTKEATSTDSNAMWRQQYLGIERLRWFYSLLEAKLLRKVGNPPREYLAVFHRAFSENKKIRENLKQPCDIEPIYQLHAARMKILRNVDDNTNDIEILNLLEGYSFNAHSPPHVEDFPGKDIEDWIAERKTAVAEDILAAMHFCSSKKSEAAYSEFYFKSVFCKAVLLAEVLKDVASALEELGRCFRLDAALKALDQGYDGARRGYFYKIWNYRFTDTGIEPAIETERKLVRWRGKLLGFYGQLLKQTSDWRSLAAIIYRLKKRNAEDLPVDGALLDDLLEAYAVTSRAALLSSMEKGIITDVSAFESSYHRTWFIFEETLRLSQGVRRVRVGLNRGEKNETGGHRLVRSGRPRCLVPMHTALRLEHMRWKSALDGVSVNLVEMRGLPTQGRLRQISRDIRMSYANTLQVSVGKWRLDEKMTKLLTRRITELAAPAE